MGTEVLERYERNFRYGNAHFSSDSGFNNGLERAWVASSLQVPPKNRPASCAVWSSGRCQFLERRTIGDWVIHGKTRAAYPRRADRSFDYARNWGWYVRWAESDGHRCFFVRLTQPASVRRVLQETRRGTRSFRSGRKSPHGLPSNSSSVPHDHLQSQKVS